jgi:hypothetical protein
MRIDGKPAIVGTVYEESGSVARPMAYILVEDASGESVRALAQYLVDGKVSEKISPAQDSEGVFPSWTARSHRSSSTLPSKVVLGAGGLALLGGAVVYAVSNPGDFVTPQYNDRKRAAVGVMLAASATIGPGVSLWLRETRSASLLTSVTLGVAATGILAGSVLYFTDEDDTKSLPGQEVRQYYRDSAEHGVIAGSIGFVTLGAGLWLLHREISAHTVRKKDPSASGRFTVQPLPTVSVTPSRVDVGWMGSF